MTDLFANLPATPRKDIGKGNALFLADLRDVVERRSTLAALRANVASRKYADLNKPWAAANVAFWGLA